MANVVKIVICLTNIFKLILFSLSYFIHLAPLTFCGKPALQSNAKMHHKRIRVATVQSIFSGLNRVRQLVRPAVDYIEDLTWKTTRCHRIWVNAVTLKVLSEPAVGTTLDPLLLPGMMKSVGVGLWDTCPQRVEEGKLEFVWANQKRPTHTGYAIKYFRGTFSISCAMRPRGSLVYRRIMYFNMAGKFVRPRIENLNNLRIS